MMRLFFQWSTDNRSHCQGLFNTCLHLHPIMGVRTEYNFAYLRLVPSLLPQTPRRKRRTNMKCALCGKEIRGMDYINASTPEKRYMFIQCNVSGMTSIGCKWEWLYLPKDKKKMTSLKIDKWSYNCTNYRRKIGCVLKKRYCCPEKCIKYTLLNLSKLYLYFYSW